MNENENRLRNALLIFVLDDKIRAWLRENDLMALNQALAALGMDKSMADCLDRLSMEREPLP